MLTLVRSALETSQKLGLQSDAGSVALTDAQREELLRWSRAATTPQRVVTRSTIVLLAAAGWTDSRIASELGISRRTVSLWRGRFAGGGPRALLVDAPGRGRKPGRDAAIVQKVLTLTSQAPPSGSRWTVRSLARAAGVSHATVQRVWKEHAAHLERKVS